MNLTDGFTLKCMRGSTILFDDVCALFPPTLGQIVDYGYENFLESLQLLILEKPEGEDNLSTMAKDLSVFEYFLLVTAVDPKIRERAKQAFDFFIHEEVTFSPNTKEIIIGPLDEKRILNEDNFYTFQRALRKMHFIGVEEEEIIFEEDDDPKVIALKKQFIKNREKVARAKRKANAGKSELKFSDLIGSVALGECGTSLNKIWDMTYYAFNDQLKRMQWREQFDINNRAAIAGAKLDKDQLQHWIKAIASK